MNKNYFISDLDVVKACSDRQAGYSTIAILMKNFPNSHEEEIKRAIEKSVIRGFIQYEATSVSEFWLTKKGQTLLMGEEL